MHLTGCERSVDMFVWRDGIHIHLTLKEMVFGEDAQNMFEYGLAGVFQDKRVNG